MNIGKKILSAFVEVTEEKARAAESPDKVVTENLTQLPHPDTDKFSQYFDKLFTEANIPGPDYYEFSKMVEAMKSISDEKARYAAAFAGLCVQGLDKDRLLDTANQYLKVVDADAVNFNATIEAAVAEMVQSKRNEIEEKQKRLQEMSKEMTILQTRIMELSNELKQNEEKLRQSKVGYETGLESTRSNILSGIEKIRKYIS
jgi:hypothetical protein